jgi:hypothetical protein
MMPLLTAPHGRPGKSGRQALPSCDVSGVFKTPRFTGGSARILNPLAALSASENFPIPFDTFRVPRTRACGRFSRKIPAAPPVWREPCATR